MNPEKIFERGLRYHHYANTAYPLTPASFRHCRISDPSRIGDFLRTEWEKTQELSLYVHIPFCRTRCRFCEYTVLSHCDEATENLYVSLLLREIEMYRPLLAGKTIVGYDMGGGTPTRLSTDNILKITRALRDSFDFEPDVVFSIETTPAIASDEPDKIARIHEAGYHRISMGIQTVSEKLLNELGREGTTHVYEKAMRHMRQAGYTQINVDLMYGFLNQDDDDFENTLRYAVSLNPEFITLYRNRYKGTKLEKEAGGVSLYKIICQYRLARELLIKNGYLANAGKNTFSRIEGNHGTSDYLTHRVIRGTPYAGFGLGAQSFGIDYLAYNEGAASKKLDAYREKIESGQFPIQDIYRLSVEESIAKMVSVAFYFGFVDLDAFAARFGRAFDDVFPDEIAFVIKEGLMKRQGHQLALTSRGADYINGVIPLFYSPRSKEELMTFRSTTTATTSGEAEFLKAYRIEEFERPSLAADIVLFREAALNRDAPRTLLLIRRGEHPFMDWWALPGGFVRPGESVEQTAHRELLEETGVSAQELRQLHVESLPDRDPRGWIVSCAFVGAIDPKSAPARFGDDAIGAAWFDVSLAAPAQMPSSASDASGDYRLVLTGETEHLEAVIRVTGSTRSLTCAVVSTEGLAFDHAAIIARALLNEIYQ